MSLSLYLGLLLYSVRSVKVEINESNSVWSRSPEGAAIQISNFSAL